MSTARNLIDELEEGERLARHSRNSQDYSEDLREREICEDISAVVERRGEINLRYAMLTVLEDGDRDAEGNRVSWPFDHAFEDVANSARLRFVESVIKQLRG